MPRDPPLCKLKDYDGEALKGTFYDKERKVEKIVNKRGRGNNVYFLVKSLGYPNKFNSWVPASEINNI